jgi:hypothetical protein
MCMLENKHLPCSWNGGCVAEAYNASLTQWKYASTHTHTHTHTHAHTRMLVVQVAKNKDDLDKVIAR